VLFAVLNPQGAIVAVTGFGLVLNLLVLLADALARNPAGDLRDLITAIFLGTGIIAGLTLLPVVGKAHLGVPLLLEGIAAVIIGHAIGSRAFRRLDAARFERLLLAIIVMTGTASVILGATAL
jgi:hypothetical protein